jgi:tRNA nucleotidyltransferase/poly(A) polymerase
MLTLFGDQAIPTGLDFGTVTIKGVGRHYEVTTLRTESLYRDGRRPEKVSWGTSLSEDLSRRDFTFNSMAVDVARQALYDPYNGIADLQKRCIRAVGDANLRCQEDALRILRAYRFMRRDEGPLWHIDHALEAALSQHSTRLRMVAIERRWMEMEKILKGQRPGEVLEKMQSDGVLRYVLEEFAVVNPHLFTVLDDSDLNHLSLAQRLALLMLEYPTKEAMKQMEALRTSKALQRTTATFHEQLGHLPTPLKPELRVFNHILGNEAKAHLSILRSCCNHSINLHTGLTLQAKTVNEVIERWTALNGSLAPVSPLVDGHWIMARTGAVEGKRLGRLKGWLHRIQIEEEITELSGMEAALSRLPFEHGSPEDWPSVSFP